MAHYASSLFVYVMMERGSFCQHLQLEMLLNCHLQEGNDDTIVDDELAFASNRTVSRLTEMQSATYLRMHAEQHAPHLLLALEEAASNQDKEVRSVAQEQEAATV